MDYAKEIRVVRRKLDKAFLGEGYWELIIQWKRLKKEQAAARRSVTPPKPL